MGLYEILKASKLGAGAAPDMYTALFAQKISKGGSGGEAELSGVPPLTFPADGTPLIDLLISGNEEHSGTPTPDSPVMPDGCGNKTANLFDKSMADLYNNSTLGQTNTWAYSAESTGTTLRIPCNANTQYTLSIDSTIGNTIFRISDTSTDDVPIEGGSGGIVCHTILNGGAIKNYTFTTESDSKYILFQVNANVMTSALNTLMLNTGPTAKPFEPNGYKIPISSADTTTNNYLGEVETTRKVKKLVFTGEEAFTQTSDYQQSARFRFKANDARRGEETYSIDTIISSHYVSATGFASGTIVQSNGTDINLTFNMQSSTYPDLTTFTNWLAQQYAAGTPVCVWYVLATPTTGIVNEPLMRIGDYADTLSKEQAGVTIPTNNGSTTVDVDTTVKPSEIYIKYRT